MLFAAPKGLWLLTVEFAFAYLFISRCTGLDSIPCWCVSVVEDIARPVGRFLRLRLCGSGFCCMPYMACNFHIALNFVSRSVSGERTSHVADS
jgi:hypothetical protein